MSKSVSQALILPQAPFPKASGAPLLVCHQMSLCSCICQAPLQHLRQNEFSLLPSAVLSTYFHNNLHSPGRSWRWETEAECTRLPETEAHTCWGLSTAVWSPAHQRQWLLLSPPGPLPSNEDTPHPSRALGGWRKTSEGMVVDHHLRDVRHTDGPMAGHSVTLPRDDLPSARSRCASELCRDTPPPARQPGTWAVTVLSGCGETEAQRHSVTYAGSQPSGPSLTPTVSSSPPSTHLLQTEVFSLEGESEEKQGPPELTMPLPSPTSLTDVYWAPPGPRPLHLASTQRLWAPTLFPSSQESPGTVSGVVCPS
ncbi:uncharacterized protein LOC125093508 isoform X1 [Lutra lutra]|uniref:uncharacterized protein LOC125093508 isoform X1 n=1 Tax=Lutra lutra TaxID=9657 RepID=UPI001FD13455|nr:uncharacterized protein LOC125093508 isoform X1 [Lutra lutra]XP_047574744.1 uncharacterized protein LOC125093508 isoform X1 [Lutra lutra]XP_047574745.1 uncharacterized protein LOC125093508 isoform X1 [Lutra lutra]XP_047574746.1 uncharacterized protein LOC125093508 isoform X1 [Lutra lutra]